MKFPSSMKSEVALTGQRPANHTWMGLAQVGLVIGTVHQTA